MQQVNRDSLSFAMKASAIQVDGSWRDIYKAPITDLKKHSKKGRLALSREYKTLLEVVYKDGSLKKEYSFEEIRSLTW